MKDKDFTLIDRDYYALCKMAQEHYSPWSKTRPSTPSDHPDEEEAYEQGYLQAIADVRAGRVK